MDEVKQIRMIPAWSGSTNILTSRCVTVRVTILLCIGACEPDARLEGNEFYWVCQMV